MEEPMSPGVVQRAPAPWMMHLLTHHLEAKDRLALARTSSSEWSTVVQAAPSFTVRWDLEQPGWTEVADRRVNHIVRAMRNRGQLDTGLVLRLWGACNWDRLGRAISLLASAGDHVHTLHLDCPQLTDAAAMADAARAFPALKRLHVGSDSVRLAGQLSALPDCALWPHLTSLTVQTASWSRAQQLTPRIAGYIHQLRSLSLLTTEMIPGERPTLPDAAAVFSQLSATSTQTHTLTSITLVLLSDHWVSALCQYAPALKHVTASSVELAADHSSTVCSWQNVTLGTVIGIRELVRLPLRQGGPLEVDLKYLIVSVAPASIQDDLQPLERRVQQQQLRISSVRQLSFERQRQHDAEQLLCTPEHLTQYLPLMTLLASHTHTLSLDGWSYWQQSSTLLSALLSLAAQLQPTQLEVNSGDTGLCIGETYRYPPDLPPLRLNVLDMPFAPLDDAWVNLLLQCAPQLQQVTAKGLSLSNGRHSSRRCPWRQLTVHSQAPYSAYQCLPVPEPGHTLTVSYKDVRVCDISSDRRSYYPGSMEAGLFDEGIRQLSAQQLLRIQSAEPEEPITIKCSEFRCSIKPTEAENAAEHFKQFSVEVRTWLQVSPPLGLPADQHPAALRINLQLCQQVVRLEPQAQVVLSGWAFTPAVMSELKHLPQWAATEVSRSAGHSSHTILPDGKVAATLHFSATQWACDVSDHSALPGLVPLCYIQWVFDANNWSVLGMQAVITAACSVRSPDYPLLLAVQGATEERLAGLNELIQQLLKKDKRKRGSVDVEWLGVLGQ